MLCVFFFLFGVGCFVVYCLVCCAGVGGCRVLLFVVGVFVCFGV